MLIQQTIKGTKKLFKTEERVDLFLNTMRNVYEGLRICRLKQ
jgi:hypothetical protein